MEFGDQVVLVTGGANGIGRAICQRVALEKPRGIVIADRDIQSARNVAAEVGGVAVECDVSCEDDIQQLVAQTRQEFGRIDIVVSNAEIGRAHV